MTIKDETRASCKRGRRAVVLATAAEQIQEPIAASAGPEPVTVETSGGIASTSGMHGVAEDSDPNGEDKYAYDEGRVISACARVERALCWRAEKLTPTSSRS